MSRRILVLGILGMLVVSVLIAIGTGLASAHARKQMIRENSMELDEKAYQAHNVIRINSNSDFTSENGVVGGSGTKDDPYIISGWDIDGHRSGDGIYIGNTTMYFIIENCYIHDIATVSIHWTFYNGITLNNVVNGIIRENTIIESNDGISLTKSSQIIIENNNITDNLGGIGLDKSFNNKIVNNSISNMMSGISLMDSTNNIFWANKLHNNDISLEGGRETFTTQTIALNNTVNGKPIYYYKNENMNNQTAQPDSGEIILGNVSWFKIAHLNLSHGDVGVNIGYSSHINISENIINGEYWYGIYIENGEDITIYNNTITNCEWYGLYLSMFNNGTIENNIVENSSFYGVLLDTSNGNIVKHNLLANNSGYAIYIYSGNYNHIYLNSFYYNNGTADRYVSGMRQVRDDGTNYWNNSQKGNYWHDWANNNDSNAGGNGIVNWAYKIDGLGKDKDEFPLKTPTYPMPPLAPSPPKDLHFHSGDSYVNLTWKKPLGSGSSEITGYRIYRNGKLIAEVPATQLWYNDTNVVNGQTYIYAVTAVNSAGESPRTAFGESTPEQTVPELSSIVWVAIIVLLVIMGVARLKIS